VLLFHSPVNVNKDHRASKSQSMSLGTWASGGGRSITHGNGGRGLSKWDPGVELGVVENESFLGYWRKVVIVFLRILRSLDFLWPIHAMFRQNVHGWRSGERHHASRFQRGRIIHAKRYTLLRPNIYMFRWRFPIWWYNSWIRKENNNGKRCRMFLNGKGERLSLGSPIFRLTAAVYKIDDSGQ
jgi:hypothetical protein